MNIILAEYMSSSPSKYNKQLTTVTPAPRLNPFWAPWEPAHTCGQMHRQTHTNLNKVKSFQIKQKVKQTYLLTTILQTLRQCAKQKEKENTWKEMGKELSLKEMLKH